MDKKTKDKLAQLINRVDELFPEIVPAKLNSFCYRWVKNQFGFGQLQALPNWQGPNLAELIQVDLAIEELQNNTQSFINNNPANHALLTGPRGCGKTTIMNGVVSLFQNEKLKVIKISRDDMANLPQLAYHFAKFKYKFIVLCDELSFGINSDSFLIAKSALDEIDNSNTQLLVYATSNRRHLVPEENIENEEAFFDSSGELHPGETTEEKISFSDRFGLWIPVFSPDQDEYIDLVMKWFTNYEITKISPKIKRAAINWATERGSMNGRIANQFVRTWIANNKSKC